MPHKRIETQCLNRVLDLDGLHPNALAEFGALQPGFDCLERLLYSFVFRLGHSIIVRLRHIRQVNQTRAEVVCNVGFATGSKQPNESSLQRFLIIPVPWDLCEQTDASSFALNIAFAHSH